PYSVFFADSACSEVYTLSLHDALPIWGRAVARVHGALHAGRARQGAGPIADRSRGDGALPCRRDRTRDAGGGGPNGGSRAPGGRSEEHTSELQSRSDLVCRLLLEKKKN